MKRLLLRAGTMLIAVFGFGIAASEIWPVRTANLILAGLYLSADLEERTVNTSKGPVHYLNGGEGETVVFLHGIFALKEHWIDISREISGDYRVILLDLPGFGENARLPGNEYDYAHQTKNVLEALDKIGVTDFHVVANSMGAQIAAMIAQSQPERVRSIAFVGGPAGVTSPVQSDMDRAIAAGGAPLIVTQAEEYAKRMAWLFPVEPFVPRPMARAWAINEVSQAAVNPVIWEAVVGSDVKPLEEIAPALTQPALIIWCKSDRVFHVSGAEVLNQALPNSELTEADDCGHLPMLDRAAETGRELRDFLNRS